MKHEFIPRATMIGALMTNPRSKSERLSETAKTEIQKVVLFNKYGIEDEFSSKPTDKGLMNEPESIRMATDVFGWIITSENKIRLINDWIMGEPDVFEKGRFVADVKSSFSGLTFPWFADENECPNNNYFWQMQSYLDLTGLDEAELVYCLTNTPEQMVLDMIQRKVWKMLADPKYSDYTQTEMEEIADEQIRSQHNFNHIPIEKRVKRFIIKRDNDKIEAMRERITLCREYYDEIIKTI